MHEATIEAVLLALDYLKAKMLGEIFCELAVDGSITLQSVEESLVILVSRGDASSEQALADIGTVTKWKRLKRQLPGPHEIGSVPENQEPNRPGI